MFLLPRTEEVYSNGNSRNSPYQFSANLHQRMQYCISSVTGYGSHNAFLLLIFSSVGKNKFFGFYYGQFPRFVI